MGLGAGDGLDATGGRTAKEENSRAISITSNNVLYTYQEKVSERWEGVLVAVLVCLLGEEA